ncbi:hypothetical protein TAO_p0005 (plasmid) [Candidatus Nitrosoglobus terrae]|uniref:AlpA family phage regulatory protein n=1 Tax=Candidatus Nitrosoglobus terrae TaxID=1630141 RepID=A0A1Q2SPY1_9GAMM|nr:hypothetical protein [Candidatus Nitrosoglobus terrae]BAW81214.1 hypothetical protein TAO_p0005 [Candidatus Nitrosoglobus terrae]
MKSQLIGVTQLSRLTGIPRTTIYFWLDQNRSQIPSPVPNSKPMKWLYSDVVSFFKLDDTTQMGGQ